MSKYSSFRCEAAFVVMGVGLLLGAAGCNKQEGPPPGGSAATAAQSVQQQIKTIESDPNMPPQAKQAAISAIRSQAAAQQAQGKQQGQANSTAAGKTK